MTQRIEWHRRPEAERLVLELTEKAAAALPPLRDLADEIVARTATRLPDWIDHLGTAGDNDLRRRLTETGFERESAPGPECWLHQGAILPRIVLGADATAALKVERVADFLVARGIRARIDGSPLGPLRLACVWQADGAALLAVERHGGLGVAPVEEPAAAVAARLRALERWRARVRLGAAAQAVVDLARSLAGEIGPDAAADLAFAAERDRWCARSRAGRIQGARQDSLGLGFANHDHHTFRSSREAFPQLIAALEALGFRPRERFYAGAEAGWGAQVMEQPACGLAVFADVDLSPTEVEDDFAHAPLAPRAELGTVGLWCALHGESLLTAGLHHLAVRCDFGPAAASLAEAGVPVLSPFSDFSYLRQAFTAGERWIVDPDRLAQAGSVGAVDAAVTRRIAAGGAVGSHLEIIQRAEGFKGFNQTAVSDIIRRTDPRAASD